MRRLVVLAPVLVAAALLGRSAAQQGGGQQGFRPTAGRFVPGVLAGGVCWSLDTWTGRVHAAPAGAPGEGAKAWVVDPAEGLLWERPFARDVSGGHVLQHGLPLPGIGAGAPVFEWHPIEGTPGVLDTRTGVHYLVRGSLADKVTIVRTDLRMLTRSEREARTAAKD
jgi:hypothetical protein